MTKKKKNVEDYTPAQLQKLINQKWGEGTAVMGSDPSLAITRIPSGILSLDWALGGGFPRGRHSEIFGNWSTGKTYASLRLIASAQKLGMNTCYLDAEGSFDPDWATSIGIETNRMTYHRQVHGNQMVDLAETLLRSRLYGVIVLDSIAALIPKPELDQDMETVSYGTQQAKMMSAAMRKLTTANDKTALIYINQMRDSIGSIFRSSGVTPGGRAMSFYAGVRLEMVKMETIKRPGKVIDPKSGEQKKQDVVRGHRALVKIVKDKTGGSTMGQTTQFVFDYNTGSIDPTEDLLYVGRNLGLVKKKGLKFAVKGFEDEAQTGKERFRKWLKTNKAVAEELQEQIEAIIYDGKGVVGGTDL